MPTTRARPAVTTAAATALLAAVVVTAGGPAIAADTDAVVTGGGLTVTAPTAASFTAVVLDGAPHTLTATLGGYSVTDATGTGSGWNVTAQASTFTTGGTAPRTLPADWLSVSAPTVTANGTTSADPSVTAGPYAIGVGAVKIASAAVDTGMGRYDFSATTMTLSLPASVYAGTYTSTVTVSVTTGP